jgi:hypothetical protein
VKNIKCGFGADITTIPDNTVQLYSSDSTGFKHFAATNETNTKRIDLLWYNKNEDNQYLGFTDGVEKPDYDEVDYLNLTETERKIIAQKGKGNIPTDRNGLLISANAEESFSILESSKRLVEKDLKNTIEAFRDRLIESQASKSFDTIFGAIDGFIAQLTAGIANLKSYFENNLTFAYQVQKV